MKVKKSNGEVVEYQPNSVVWGNRIAIVALVFVVVLIVIVLAQIRKNARAP